MFELRKILFLLYIGLLYQVIDSTDDLQQYCNLENYCISDGSGTSTLHIGCPNNYKTLKSHYKVLKLKYNDRNFLINEINQFRSDVALGEIYANKMTSSTFSYMNKLKWSYEMENLLNLMITKHSNNRFYCMSTNEDHKPIQLTLSFDRPQVFSLEKVFSLAIQEIKSKALQSYSLASRNEIINWSQCYHPETWAFACAVGEFNSALKSNDKSMLIRCAFYGKRFKKSKDDFTYGELCSGCGTDGCSDLFPGLCGADIIQIRGQNGVSGPPGYRGRPGQIGAKGERGRKGPEGSDGVIGITGENGEQGMQGYPGIDGQSGPKGMKGPPGKSSKPEDCSGFPGLNGPKGAMGPEGPKGAIGEVGDKGEPAISTKGERGDPGLSVQGEKGDHGNVGDIGLSGTPGEIGQWGDEGDEFFEIDVRFGGVDSCVKCTPGPKGLPGLQGPQGARGADGKNEISNTTSTTTIDVEVTTLPK